MWNGEMLWLSLHLHYWFSPYAVNVHLYVRKYELTVWTFVSDDSTIPLWIKHALTYRYLNDTYSLSSFWFSALCWDFILHLWLRHEVRNNCCCGRILICASHIPSKLWAFHCQKDICPYCAPFVLSLWALFLWENPHDSKLSVFFFSFRIWQLPCCSIYGAKVVTSGPRKAIKKRFGTGSWIGRFCRDNPIDFLIENLYLVWLIYFTSVIIFMTQCRVFLMCKERWSVAIWYKPTLW